MIILRLRRAKNWDTEFVTYMGDDEYSNGFMLMVPASEARSMGDPDEVSFVCSPEKLSVGAGNEVRAA
jgi:hypothetical protein